jgi:flagellar protein FlaF
MSVQAYQRAATQGDTPRELEYRAFGQVTAGLVRARDENLEHGALAAVLDTNRRLWNILSADCSMPENKMPLALRASIISLALWVSKYSSDVLREGAEIDPLIDVNRSMMEGLNARP